MPEYLSPGVFIEEVPARLKAIEGVSTSTAGFVGDAERGPTPGFVPFNPAPATFGVQADLAPVLVTSLSDFRRAFGEPSTDPEDPSQPGYLGHAVRAFFDNGGRRCFVARVLRTGATAASVRVATGARLRLARRYRSGDAQLFLSSLRGLTVGGTFDVVGTDGTVLQTGAAVTALDPQAGSVSMLAFTSDYDVEQVFVAPTGVTVTASTGPVFHARNPGNWGNDLRVLISGSDRPAVPVTTAVGGGGSTQLTVQTAGSFYRGAFVEIDHGGGTTKTLRVVTDILGNTLQLGAAVTSVATTGFVRVLEIDVSILDNRTRAVESYRRLSWNAAPDPDVRRRYYATVINAQSRLVFVQPPWTGGLGGPAETTATLDEQPMTLNGYPQPLTGGVSGAAPPTPAQVVGTDTGPGQRTGIQALQDIDDIRIVAAPGETSTLVQNELITQCERMRYRFAVLDGERRPNPAGVVNDILRHRNAYDSTHAAYYTPWQEVGDGDRRLVLPPSGYVAGIYARTDNDRGVWKAPANEVLRNVTGLSLNVTTGEQDLLNPRGVNAIRRFEGRGIRVWGARTLSSDPESRYVNVRRFLIFLEASIDRGTQWVVFEPNSPETWTRVVDSVSAFLHSQWRSGALFGRRPEDAFFVRCDETTMGVDDVQNGRLICNIGVAIVRPAEFVIFRIEQITGFGARA